MRWLTKRRRKPPKVTYTYFGTFPPLTEECRRQRHRWEDPLSADTVCLRCKTRRRIL